jgi:hypothetical protein
MLRCGNKLDMHEQSPAERYLRSASVMLDLPIPDVFFAEVAAAFEVISAQAALIEGFALPEAVEAAPRFVP